MDKIDIDKCAEIRSKVEQPGQSEDVIPLNSIAGSEDKPICSDPFTHIYRESSGWLCLWTKRDKRSEWLHYPEHAREALQRAKELAKTDDVYFGVNLYKENLGSARRGTAKDAKVLPALFLDIDVMDGSAHKSSNLPSSMTEAYQFLESLPLPPSFTVDSGYGIHAYWLFDEPIDIEKAGLDRVSRMMKGWNEATNGCAAVHGWKFDMVCEPARVLRVPGTLNHKASIPVSVGPLEGSMRRYSTYQLKTAHDEMLTHVRKATAQMPKRIPEGQRNSTLASYAGVMRHRGMTLEQIESALLEKNRTECQPPLSEAEVRTIAKSIARYEAGEDPANQKDYGHALVLSRLFLNHYRWAVHRKEWMEYTGGVWKSASEERMALLAAEALRQKYSVDLAVASEKPIVNALTNKIKEVCIFARISGALSFLKGWTGVMTEPEEWDKDGWLFNVENGTLDLRNGDLRPHNPTDLLTKIAPVPYLPRAIGLAWNRHLDIFLPNPSIRRQVQRSLGLALVGATLEEVLDIWYGTGANGKTTTSRVIMSICGDYSLRAAPDLLIESKFDRHPTEVADLCGSRVVFSVEVPEGKRLAEALVKDLTGGDRKKARFMGRDFFEFEQTFSFFLIANHRPGINGCDEGIWRRIRLVPWEHRISAEHRRPQEEVHAELLGEASAILNWLLDGLRDWQMDHDWRALEVQAATDAYRQEQDYLSGFLKETCETGPRYTVPVSDLYSTYNSWCEAAGEESMTKTKFGKLLKNRGLEQKRSGHDNASKWWGSD